MQSKLTTKGQITLPKALRDHLKLHVGDRVEFLVLPDGRVELLPVAQSVTKLKGMVPPPDAPVSLEQMEKTIRERAARK